MNERGETPRTDPSSEPTTAFAEMPTDRSAIDAEEIRGWALQWDTAALRRANLARTMRALSEAGGDH